MNASAASQSHLNPPIRNVQESTNPKLRQALQPPPIKHSRSTKSRLFSTLANPQRIIGCNALTQYLIPAKVTSALRSTSFVAVHIHTFAFGFGGVVAGIVGGEGGIEVIRWVSLLCIYYYCNFVLYN